MRIPIRYLSTALAIVFLTSAGASFAGSSEEKAPQQVAGATRIDVAKARELYDHGVPFVDVRKDGDWQAGRVAGAVHLEVDDVLTPESLGKVAGKDDEVVFYCNGVMCLRSSRACGKAVSWGWKHIYYFREGMPAWEGAGLPVE